MRSYENNLLSSRNMPILNGLSFVTEMDAVGFRSVERHLIKSRDGSDREVESTLMFNTTPSSKQSAAIDILSPLFDDEDKQWLANLESDELSKIRPFSKVAPFADVRKGYQDAFFRPSDLKLNIKSCKMATRRVQSLLRPNGLRKSSILSVLDETNMKTQWGLPYYISRPDSDQVAQYVNLAESDLSKGRLTRYPCISGTRMQITKIGQPLKQRLVWMYPHHVVLLESQYSLPLMKALRDHCFEFASQAGPDSTDRAMDKVFKFSQVNNSEMISLDFPEFDQKIKRPIVDEIFDCISFWFVGDDHYFLDHLKEYFLTCDLLTPLGLWEGRDGGIPSGSAFTSVVGTLCHIWIKEYILIRTGRKFPNGISLHAGDDGVWCIPGLTLDDVKNGFLELNIAFNPEKFVYSKIYAVFLQRHYHQSYKVNGKVVGVRIFTRSFATMCHFERPVGPGWNKYLESVRWIAQLENLKYHPCFKQIIISMCKLDKLGLGTRAPGGVSGLFKLAGGTKEIESKLSSFMWLPNQAYGKVVDSELQVVKTLAELVRRGEIEVNRGGMSQTNT
uniref:RdRp n=1 Tax=viral metagenome TaxID=1070528 RepID=A0A2V0RAR9_9ZZZZ